MLGNIMEDTVNTALQKSKIRLNNVRGSIPPLKLSVIVLNNLVTAVEILPYFGVGSQLISHNARIFMANLFDGAFEGLSINAFDRLGDYIAITLH